MPLILTFSAVAITAIANATYEVGPWQAVGIFFGAGFVLISTAFLVASVDLARHLSGDER